MNIDMRIEALIWFGTEKVYRVEMRPIMSSTALHYRVLILTHTEVTNTMSTVYTTLDYEYRHENRGTYLVWYLESVPCRNETKETIMSSTNLHCYRVLILTHRSHQYHAHCLHHSRFEERSHNIKKFHITNFHMKSVIIHFFITLVLQLGCCTHNEQKLQV